MSVLITLYQTEVRQPQLVYHVAALAYTLCYLCIFYVLSRYPALIKPMLIGGNPDTLTNFEKLPSALLVALLLTGFVQKIPVLSQVDKWLRDRLQYLAAIPFEVRRLAKQLYSSEFYIDEKTQNEVYKRLRDEGLVCEDINFEDHSEIYWLWNKTSVLMYHLSQWNEQRKTSAYMTAKYNGYKNIKSDYNQLAELAKSCLKLCSESKENSEENSAFAELTKTFKEQCRSLIRHQCEFISHGALKCNFTTLSRRTALQDMGFQIPDEEESGLTVNQMATLLLALVGGILMAMILFGSSFGSTSRSLYIISLVVTMNMVAVATVVFTKGKWAISNPDANGQRPVFYYLAIAIIAVVISIPITLFFKTIIGMTAGNLEFSKAVAVGWEAFIDKSYPWKVMIFTTALCLAFQLDTTRVGKFQYPTMRWIEGVIQAVVAMVAAYVTYEWLISIPENARMIPHLNEDGKMAGLALDTLLIRSAIIGMVIGYTIPYWFKVSEKQSRQEVDEDFVSDGPQKSLA